MVAVVLVVIIGIAVLRVGNGGEDNWIKDERGVYVKHGNPAETPSIVSEQQDLIARVMDLYNQKKTEGMHFSSQCLGSVDDYAVDIVHVPRSAEDEKTENQCEDFRNRIVSHFIELDEYGEIVRIVWVYLPFN